EIIKQSIQKDLLDLRIEPRLGTAIRGAERNKRNLLARLIKKGKNGQKKQTYLQEFFEKGVIEKVNKIVKNVDL
ncbi:MAG: hypothetical protein L0I93_04740, partial [Atopostipes suicloacalis]|nr:hypothetical protein [Atopostipes suicloacalis]